MAPRSRRSAAAEVVEQEEEDSLKRLKFKQPLIGKPGKPISVGELLTRLKALCEELRGLEQEEADRESLEPVAKDLAHQSLLHHKDAGVRAWTACCIVDMFRLCAPDAPYTAAQLKDIFTLIVVKIFPLLADPSNPYNGQHLYVLKCLAEVKSIVLLTDIPSSGHLTTTLFRTCFDVLSGPSKATNGEELSKNVEHHMTAVLAILIDEAVTLSSDVVDVIMAQFLWADPISLGAIKGKKSGPIDLKQSTLLRKEAPPAYNMAKNLCNSCPDKMARYVGTYFRSVIIDFTSLGTALSKHKSRLRASSVDDESEDDAAKGPSEEDLNDAHKAHRLLRELWRCAPSVLQDIIPHLQEELGTENIQLRQLATETFGDMIAGIGAAGPPPPPDLNPAAYPSQSLTPSVPRPYNFLTTPTSPNSFSSQYPGAYHSFLQRKHDKSPLIRAAWATGIGRILMTSAGGVGLESEEEERLLRYFAETLIDSDERVRLAAVRTIENFDFDDIVQKLGRNGTMSEPGSVLSNLADRVKDKRNVIHTESIKLLGKIWGVAVGAIAEGNERVTALLGPIPSRILEACYVNDLEITRQVDLTFFESLLPLGYPPMKPKASANGLSQIVKDSQSITEPSYTEADLDKIRVERQLVLVNGLEEKAKKVFFARQANQARGAPFMETFLKLCEEYNGGVTGNEAKDTKTKLQALIDYYGRTLPDSSRVVGDLWKFAETHDRRSYQLIRFCMAPESEYRKIPKSIKELRRRLEDSHNSSLLETLIPLVYRVSLLCYNKSHVPAIITYSRTDEGGLGATAHEVLKEISTNNPKVFSTHVKELCKALEDDAPTANSPNSPGAVDNLKACSGFAKKFPKEIPLDAKDGRKLVQSFVNFALYGSPPKAAKHAITIIIHSDSKKEMRAKEILAKSIKSFEYGGDHFLTKLAAISQLVLLAPQACEDDADAIVDIAVNRVLLRPHDTSSDAESEWMASPDDDMIARTWALKILVNRLRSLPPEKQDITEYAKPVYSLLNKMVKESGEASKKKNTPLAHKNLQLLLAAQLLIKLSCMRRFDALLTPEDFNQLALVTHNKQKEIREGFVAKLKKYLGQNRLPQRFYALMFFFAYEPDNNILEGVMTWIRARRHALALRQDITFELVFARLLSLLAYHPDFENDNETLKVMSKYILFYLKCVAIADNISLIYHVAQRVKGVADGIAQTPQADERLYVLSDLSQALIRIWEEVHGWSMQSWPGSTKLPAGIFKKLETHERAQEIADKVWIDEEITEELEPLVRKELKSKKRKATDGGEKNNKKVKTEKAVKKDKTRSERPVKTPKSRRRKADDSEEEDEEGERVVPSSREPRRKSDRRSTAKSYVEVSSDEDEEEAEDDAGEEEEEEIAEENEKASSEREEAAEDVEMAEPDSAQRAANGDQEEEAEEAEKEPKPAPQPASARKRTSRKQTATANGTVEEKEETSTLSLRGGRGAERSRRSGPVEASSAASEKSKANNKLPQSSSPATTGSVRRSARTRA
ncbi:uncharacterized protein EI97DRAFT_465908 [Westerdykella ornata]|uniref:Sister chromatid cohesion and DNA repair protein n=1 Tax=Westerdykella ornata TaxID=318751 RepID=A0A6A6JMG3_WESOR|nr:uncharacterized protein EI97DRAFT_465908 [Westerdykella ornata]KAF2277781.1 hypothetical protein EI97DRAFT_465908 [Westerdykella ornata]